MEGCAGDTIKNADETEKHVREDIEKNIYIDREEKDESDSISGRWI